jgi:O-antigen/teichoic acid export membrane protein
MLRGVSWTAVSQVLSQLATIATTVILARLLMPSDFGVVGMAALYTGLVAMLGQIGMGAALIHRQDVGQTELDTVFWTGIAVGSVIALVSVVLAPISEWFFSAPLIVPLIRVSSAVFVFDSLGAVHRVLMQKEMEFGRLAKAEVGSMVAYACTAMTLALLGAGVWAIVVGRVVASAVQAVLVWRVEPWRPRRQFSKDAFRNLFGFGARVWAFNFVNYVRENVDNLAVGRMLGATQLGFYAFAYDSAAFPRRQLQNVVGRVMFPAFSKAQDDNAVLRSTYLKVIRYISLLAFPALSGLAMVAPELIPLVYGDKWIPSVLPLQFLCGAQMLYSIGGNVGAVYLAKGRPDLHLKFGTIALAWLALVVIVVARFGIVAVAAGILFYTMGSVFVGQALANPLVEMRMSECLKALLPASIGCVSMAVAVVGLRFLALHTGALPPLPWLVVAILMGAAVYTGTIYLLRPPEADEVFRLVRDRVSAMRRRPMIAPPASSVIAVDDGPVEPS